MSPYYIFTSVRPIRVTEKFHTRTKERVGERLVVSDFSLFPLVGEDQGKDFSSSKTGEPFLLEGRRPSVIQTDETSIKSTGYRDGPFTYSPYM